MQKIEIQGEIRQHSGKGVARKLRAAGKIPAILYSAGKSTMMVLPPKEIQKVLQSASGSNALISLRLGKEGEVEEKVAILRDYQTDPITGYLLHADLFEVSMTERIQVRVSVEITGSVPVGVKEGGLLQHNVREIEIRCLPNQIPDHVRIDASNLAIGEVFYIRDLNLGEGVEIMEEKNQSLVSVTAPMSEAKMEELLASGKEEKEPEVAGKAKEEEPGAEGAKTEAKSEKGSGEAKTEPKGK